MNAPVVIPYKETIYCLTQRLIDALIREDVAGCQSRSMVLSEEEVPHEGAAPGKWLKWELQQGILWVPVLSCTFMQPWQWSGDALVWAPKGPTKDSVQLDRYDQVLFCLRPLSRDEHSTQHQAYEAECDTAVDHDQLCRQEKARWFHHLRQSGEAWPRLYDWAGRVLFYDRLAAFLDHPFYPSARAKSGFDTVALQAYAPEFAPTFKLRWLAVPRTRTHQLGDLPRCWPDFPSVGLNASLADDYQLVPVHPHLWHTALPAYLADTDLEGQVHLAPTPALWVHPTLSVRTLQVSQEPHVHLKVPLTIRTLGARNIRTVKPSTLYDGATVQHLLAEVAASDLDLRGRYRVTDESAGTHVDDLTWLGVIVRRYPDNLAQTTIVPVAALLAQGADGRCAIEALAERFYKGDLETLIQHYLELTLGVHLRLWLKYGIALESNQQNSMLVLHDDGTLQLLLKDNDAPRLWPARLCERRPDLAPLVDGLRDARIRVNNEVPLAQMFTTITLQLNAAVLLEGLVARGYGTRRDWYRRLRNQVEAILQALEQEGIATAFARHCLLEEKYLYAKYLLRAGSLESKVQTGAADINKFYGKTAPNFLRRPA